MKFYIASRLENAAQVEVVRDSLSAHGHTCSYDWTMHGSVRGDLARLREVGDREVRGVKDADVVIVLLPGGRGAHVELGVALATGVPIILYSSDLALFGADEETCAFYHCGGLRRVRSILEALEAVAEIAEAAATTCLARGQDATL